MADHFRLAVDLLEIVHAETPSTIHRNAAGTSANFGGRLIAEDDSDSLQGGLSMPLYL
jgi:hypothetical protein